MGWCATCRQATREPVDPICKVCGLPQDTAGECPACRAERPHFRALRAWAVFDDRVRNALHRLKYKRDMSMGATLAAEMLPFVEKLGWQVDLIIPVPLSRQRLRERGYNQVAMIAMPLAMGLNVHYAPRQLIRGKETRTQVGLSRAERKENTRNAFQAHPGVTGKTVLVIDDVATTGSTLSACAEALMTAGAKEVYALTVARALSQHGLGRA